MGRVGGIWCLALYNLPGGILGEGKTVAAHFLHEADGVWGSAQIAFVELVFCFPKHVGEDFHVGSCLLVALLLLYFFVLFDAEYPFPTHARVFLLGLSHAVYGCPICWGGRGGVSEDLTGVV